MLLAHSQSPVGRQRFARREKKITIQRTKEVHWFIIFFLVQLPMDIVKHIFAIDNQVK